MANTNMDALFPEFWAASFDDLDIGKYYLQDQVSRDTEGLIARAGDTINVPITPDLADADDWTPGASITATDITQEVAQVVLNNSKRKTISLTNSELSQSPYRLIETYGVPLAKTIARAVNLDIYLELMKSANFVDALTAVDEDNVVDAKVALDNNEISDMGRKLVIGPDDCGALLKLDAFQHTNVSGSDEAMTNGLLQKKFGFNIMENNIISTYTPADVLGAVDNAAGYAAGTTTMVVKDFNDDTNPIRPGDIFIIADEAGTPYHSVVSTTTTASDTTGITFTPALIDAVADSQVITVTPSRSMLAFVPSACALAARAYDTLPEGSGAKSMIGNYMGLPIRVTVWVSTTTLNLNVQYDILYGVKLIKSERVVRILRS